MKELIVGGVLTPQFLFEGESRLLHCENEARRFAFPLMFIVTHFKEMLLHYIYSVNNLI